MCVWCVFVSFSQHIFFLSIPYKIFSSPCTMCVFDSTFASSSSLSSVSISIFVCFESVSGCLSLNILCYYKCLHIARVHRSRRYYHFFSQHPLCPPLLSTPTLTPFRSLPHFRYVFCLAMLQLCCALLRRCDVYSAFT